MAGVAALVLGLDITTKALVVAHLTPGEPVHVIGDILEWNLLRNSGAAFSFGTGYTAIFTAAGHRSSSASSSASRPGCGAPATQSRSGCCWPARSGNLGDRIFRAPGHLPGRRRRLDQRSRATTRCSTLPTPRSALPPSLFVVLSLLGIHMDGTRYSPGDAVFPGGTTPLSTPGKGGRPPFHPPPRGNPHRPRAPGPRAYRAGLDRPSAPGTWRLPGWGRPPRRPGPGAYRAGVDALQPECHPGPGCDFSPGCRFSHGFP